MKITLLALLALLSVSSRAYAGDDDFDENAHFMREAQARANGGILTIEDMIAITEDRQKQIDARPRNEETPNRTVLSIEDMLKYVEEGRPLLYQSQQQ